MHANVPVPVFSFNTHKSGHRSLMQSHQNHFEDISANPPATVGSLAAVRM